MILSSLLNNSFRQHGNKIVKSFEYMTRVSLTGSQHHARYITSSSSTTSNIYRTTHGQTLLYTQQQQKQTQPFNSGRRCSCLGSRHFCTDSTTTHKSINDQVEALKKQQQQQEQQKDQQHSVKVSSEPTPAEVDIHNKDETEVEQQVNSQGVRIEPQYYIEFTCTHQPHGASEECGFRSKKTFSKHSYHKGVVIIRCEGCKKYHLIADHLGWTGYGGGKTIEDFMAEKGDTVKRYMVEKDDEVEPSNKDSPIKSISGNNNENNKK
ncbi:hypothetical protein SAMD00019534_120940 [Acytostelium subglobosum LB1]|uniref:hypothetical protein n=1 Tax=Acytostelium subglobosum LB1 TaxID=1410327 RepID=UPI0006451566|nr:hypothetical protein SAMD00019534_120940 [Acytostelium subglobosum LB1]GAM28918.1 hypothetical protein SAMD00019534_120940 [Acytostelium subglobosum LB1]|eukprot:XP_012748103.1 hypothetical protein SAMD00019534_120940 [Acytostelium subglobosum LB1]